ncbi:MAG: hypothetical protein WAN65_27605 [Candidatus Sulfotelmatobacter sp.]
MSNDSQNSKELLEIYKIAVETWRSQVDSSWQRSSYFSAFETAAIGGCWLLVSSKDPLSIWAGIGFSIGGFLLTAIWFVSTYKTYMYVRHWWDSLRKVEEKVAPSPFDFASQLEAKPTCIPYKVLVLSVPILFIVGWLSLFGIGVGRMMKILIGH